MSNTVGYAWTFAFLLMAFCIVALALIALISSNFAYNTFAFIVLLGTLAIVIRSMYLIVWFDQYNAVLSNNNKSNPFQVTIATSCPDYNTQYVDEKSGNISCTNQHGNIFFGTPEVTTRMLNQVDLTTVCAPFSVGNNQTPWLAARKYCEYANQL